MNSWKNTKTIASYHIFTNVNNKLNSNKNKVLAIDKKLVKDIPFWKRTMDISGAICGLIVFAPLFLFIAIIIKIVSPGPIFFKQKRIGCGGVIFNFIKFRTMKENSNHLVHKKYLQQLISSCNLDKNNGKPMEKLKKDQRIIKYGHFLRASGLDELPQLVNVLMGQMSLVGPRPPIPYEAEQYRTWYRGRFDVVPGLTGLWQTSGKNKLGFNEMIRLDIQYARKRSLFLDLKIIIKTPYILFLQVRDLKTGRISKQL